MASRPLRRAKIDEHVASFLSTRGIANCGDLLKTPLLDLVEMGLSAEDAHAARRKVAALLAPKAQLATDLAGRRLKGCLKTTLLPLDQMLRGGLLPSSITEVTGPAGAGKTQLSTMLSVVATLTEQEGGMGGSVLYIDTEGAFSAERLVEIARARFPDVFQSAERLLELSNKIFLIRHQKSAQLQQTLKGLESLIVEKSVKFIVLDSVASLLRKEFCGMNSQKQDLLSEVAGTLKTCAETFSIPVLVTNQITTRAHAADASSESDTVMTAALGNTWAHSVNTRIVLEFSSSSSSRVARLVKSPLAPGSLCRFRITKAGFETAEWEMAEEHLEASAEATRIQGRLSHSELFANVDQQHAQVDGERNSYLYG